MWRRRASSGEGSGGAGIEASGEGSGGAGARSIEAGGEERGGKFGQKAVGAALEIHKRGRELTLASSSLCVGSSE